jgi:hypothetical protein
MGRLRFRERDERLKLVAARLAFPQMAHAVPVQILGPFRQKNDVATLSAMVLGSAIDLFSKPSYPCRRHSEAVALT